MEPAKPRPDPDLRRRVLTPSEARAYINAFHWTSFGFDERPRSFEGPDGYTYRGQGPWTDDEAITLALTLIDYELAAAIHESKYAKTIH